MLKGAFPGARIEMCKVFKRAHNALDTGIGNRTRANAVLATQVASLKERYPKPLDHTGEAAVSSELRRVGFEPTRIAPVALKATTLTTRSSSLKWCYSESNRGSGSPYERKFFREFKVPCPDLLDYSTRSPPPSHYLRLPNLQV